MWRLDPGRTPVVVAEHTPDAPQLPASVMKLVTSGGALLSLGPSFRFRTSIYTSANAVRDGRVLRGTVYLKGSGDPVLATPAYARAYLEGRGGVFNGITRELSAGGVRLVRGPIVADESLFDSRRTGLQWRSYYTLYSPPLSALNVNQNHQGDGQARYVPDSAGGGRRQAAPAAAASAWRPPPGRTPATAGSPRARSSRRSRRSSRS
ncbi:MAG: D-alanyl-D-alanine carboxypeptidase [Thermoleophilia bacterium]